MKLRTAMAFGVGYVLGARAGRERYDQLRNLYRRVASNDQVRQVIDQSKGIVDTGTTQVRDLTADQLRNAGDAIRNRANGG